MSFPHEASERQRRRTLVWHCLGLAAILDGYKLSYLFFGSPNGPEHYVGDIAFATHADHLFVLFVFVSGELALLAASGAPRIEAAVWRLYVALCFVFVVYTAINSRVYSALHVQLTYPLLTFGTDVAAMRSSISEVVTPRLLRLVGMPLLYLALTWLASSQLRLSWSRRLRVAMLGVAAIVVLGQAEFSRRTYAASWIPRLMPAAAQNPQWIFASSLWAEVSGRRAVYMDDAFPPSYMDDFASIGVPAPPPLAIPGGTRPRNLIVVVLESVAARYLGLYGAHYGITPRLEREAAHSLVFDNVYATAGLSAASMFAMIDSIYPDVTARPPTDPFREAPGQSIARILKARNYRTAFVFSGSPDWGAQSEFMRRSGFDDILDQLGPPLFSWGTEDRFIVDGIRTWIDVNRARPFLIVAWTSQTHHPYALAPGGTAVEFSAADGPPGGDFARYLGAVKNIDEQLGRLFDVLRAASLADDTIVIVTGDHGESFGRPHPGTVHGLTVFEETVHVPMVVWAPGLYMTAQRADILGSHLDLSPTIADLLGVPPSPGWEGRSLLRPRDRRVYFFGLAGPVLGVREGGYKYIFDVGAATERLFFLPDDPDEQSNVAPGHAELSRQLRSRLSAWMAFLRSRRLGAPGRPFSRAPGS